MPQLQEENNVLREVTKKLSGEIEEHRAQTRQLLKDIEKKGNQVERLRDKLYNMERSSESDVSINNYYYRGEIVFLLSMTMQRSLFHPVMCFLPN